MELFYDGASIAEAEHLLERGLIRGITTNLSFCSREMKKTGQSYTELLQGLVKFADSRSLPISIQTTKRGTSDIIDEVRMMNSVFKSKSKIYYKIPQNFENLRAMNVLNEEGIQINATCVMSSNQGVTALQAGAEIISFFWGKMEDEGIDSYSQITLFKRVLNDNKASFPNAKVLVGSIRQPSQIIQGFAAGADIVTTQSSNFVKLAENAQSSLAEDLFFQDWES